MKQYWTPLARLLGMVDSHSVSTESGATRKTMGTLSLDASLWPDLFISLQKYANEVWCPRALKHAEVNPNEILLVSEIRLQARTKVMNQQLHDWFNETDLPHLIQWMVNGPFNSDEIFSKVNFEQFKNLVIVPFVEKNKQNQISPYLVPEDTLLQDEHFLIEDVCHWTPKQSPAAVSEAQFAIDISIEDSCGSRHLQSRCSQVIFGTEKTVIFPNGNEIDLKDQTILDWNNAPALFVNVHSKHVSGMHVLVTLNAVGFLVQDLHSTNGTYLNNQRLFADPVQLPQDQSTLALGGPFSDMSEHSAKVYLRAVRDGMFSSQSVKTPLRTPSTIQSVQFQFVISKESGAGFISLERCPFLIGRDAECQWVVPAENPMVSRRHLKVLAMDINNERIQIQDISRYGLTFLDDQQTGPDPVWMGVGQTLTLGQTPDYTGFRFNLNLQKS